MLILSKVLVNAPQLLRFRGRWPLSLRPCSRTGNLSLEGEEMVFPSVVKDRFLSVSISFGYRSWDVMSAFIVNGHRYQPLFLNGDRNRSTCITCIPCIPFAGNEQGLKDLVSVMQFFEGSLTARLLITMGSGSSAQYQLTAEEAVQWLECWKVHPRGCRIWVN